MALRKLRKTLKPVIWVLTILFIASLLAVGGSGIAGTGERNNKVVVKVNGEKIKELELERVFSNAISQYQNYYGNKIDEEFIKLMMFNGLIEQKVIAQHAKEYGVKVSSAEIKKEYEDITKDMDKETIKRMLFMQGLTKDKFKKELKASLIAKKARDAIMAKYVPSKEEVQEYYEDNKDGQYAGKAFKDVEAKVTEDVKNMNKARYYKKVAEELMAKSKIEIAKPKMITVKNSNGVEEKRAESTDYSKYMKKDVLQVGNYKITNVMLENKAFMKLMFGAANKEAAVAAAKDEFKRDVALAEAALARGIKVGADVAYEDTFDYLRDRLSKKVRAELKPADADLKAYFESVKDLGGQKTAVKDRYAQKESADANIIFIGNKPSDEDRAVAKKKAEGVLAEAKEGKDFAELAKKYSEDPGSAASGGELGWFGKKQMVADFENAAFKGKKGEVYPEVVNTQFGYHIIKVEDKNESEAKVKASHILIQVKASDKTKADIAAKVEKVKGEAAAGKSMEELAKANSELENKAVFTNISRDGNIDGVGNGKEVADAVYAAKVNEVKTVTTDAGNYIVKTVKYVPAKAAVFEEVKEKVAKDYAMEKSVEEMDKIATQGAAGVTVKELK